MSDRQEVFEEYCRDKARELRQAKQQAAAAAASGADRKSPEDEFRALLRQEVKSTRARFDDFRKTWKKDRRFFAFGRDDREREKAFKAWLRELGEGAFSGLARMARRLASSADLRRPLRLSRQARRGQEGRGRLLRPAQGGV